MKNKPKIGQKIYVASKDKRDEPIECLPHVVTKVGRLYFSIGEGWEETKFENDSWLEKNGNYCGSRTKAYESPEVWQDEIEAFRITGVIREAIHRKERQLRGAPISILKQIEVLIAEALK